MSLLNFKDIAKIFEQIEIRLMESLKRNLHRHKSEESDYGFNWPAWQAEKLRNMENFRRENKKVLDEYSPVIDAETSKLMQEQFAEGEKNVDEIVDDLEAPSNISDKHFFGVNEQRMNALMTDITQLEKKCETAALRMTDDIYRTVLNRVQLSMSTGSMTLTQAIDDAVKEFLERGINCIQYSDGKRVNIADYVRMALRTTSTRAMLQGEAKRRLELGYDTVMVSQYGGCSETCEPWQGKAYIDDVFTDWAGETEGERGKSNYCGKWFALLSVAIKGGLFHPNCRHTLLTYIDGVTKLPELIPADKIKKQRELEQKQRAMERRIRRLKRLKAGTENPDTVKTYNKQLRQAQSELKAFIDDNDKVLKRDYSREKYYGNGVDKSGESGIIKLGGVSGALNPASKRAQTHADKFYESVRHMNTDVSRIAKNTGFDEKAIEEIKDFIFNQKHDLGGSEPEYFYPNYEMSQSWQRLIDGKNIQKHDLTLLKHEATERELMKQGYSQEEAHKVAEAKYNYSKESEEYYAEIDKLKNE